MINSAEWVFLLSKSVEIAVKTNPLWAEYVTDILIQKIGCSGVVVNEQQFEDEIAIKEVFDEVKGYIGFSDDLDFDKIKQVFEEEKQLLSGTGVKKETLGEWSVTFREIDDEEWAHSWKEYWHPQKISEKIVICPSWEEFSPQENEIVINLDPGSAFGTGTHPTTRLCVQALEDIITDKNFNKIDIADIGTGSGILAIAALKLGANSAVGVDNDEAVISVAQENAEKNNLTDKCNFYKGVASDVHGEYEIVLANILAHILIEDMANLAKLVKKDGKLILSGIILQKSQEVQESAIGHGLKIVQILQEENWVAIVAEK